MTIGVHLDLSYILILPYTGADNAPVYDAAKTTSYLLVHRLRHGKCHKKTSTIHKACTCSLLFFLSVVWRPAGVSSVFVLGAWLNMKSMFVSGE